MKTRDKIAIVLFVLILIASCLIEYFCGAASENCSIEWGNVYGRQHAYFSGHCSGAVSNSGFGDPLLTFSSIFLLVPLVYFSFSGPFFSPWTSAFLGVASFLFHAANTSTTAIMDYIGIIIFGPSIFCDFIWKQNYKFLAFFVFASMTTIAICLRVIEGTIDNLIYITQPLFTVLIFFAAYYFKKFKSIAIPAFFLIMGSITLIVANNVDEFWKCTSTQLIEPHFWGHLLIGVGATFFARGIFEEADYVKIDQI